MVLQLPPDSLAVDVTSRHCHDEADVDDDDDDDAVECIACCDC